jgi:HK97 family phage major capsid protein
MARPNEAMKAAAKRALAQRAEYGRGGTRTGAIRARQIVAGENLSDSTIKRMYSFFSRHSNNKAKFYDKKENDGGPTAWRIAWDLWGGNAGFTWSKGKVEQMNKEKSFNKFQEAITPNEKHPSEVSMEFKSENPILSETEAEDLIDSVEVIEDVEEDEQDRLFDDEMSYRTVNLSRASYIDEETRRVRIGVSSESEVERSFGLEVLSHKAEDIDMSFIKSGTAPLLNNHNMDEQIGVIEEFRLDEAAKRTVAVVRFGRSALAQEVFQDVVDGIKQNISVGYRINKLEQSNNDKIGDHYRASWTPYEASLVSIPADTDTSKVGVGRSKSNKLPNTKVKIMENEKQEINLDEVRSQSADEARKEFAKNSKEILDLAAKHNKRDLGNQAIQDQLSVDEFRGQLLETISNDVPLETPNEIGLSKAETQRFSVMRAINAMANPTDRKAQEAARFEMECSEAAQEAYGRTAQGVMLPAEVMANWNQRDMSAGSDGDLIGEDYRGQDFIDVLRNNSAVMPLATNLNGLSGDVKIPKKTAASTAAFISSEGGAAGESEMTIGNISLSPKTLGAFSDVTRQLMIQSSLDIENLIRQDLAAGMAIAIDDACLEGDGQNGKPTGITNTTGINTVSLSSAAAPTWPEMVSLESAVGVDNALLGRLSYIVNPSNYGTLKSTSKDTGSGIFIADGNGMNGYPVVVSNQLTANNYVFGNFSDLLIGFFGGLDLVVDPYTSSSSGTVRVVALQSVDAAVRNPVSFVVGS